MPNLTVRPFEGSGDGWWAEPLLFPAGPPFRVASKGVLHQVFELPAMVAMVDGKPVGIAIYRVADGECELVVLHSAVHNIGAGTALVEAVVVLAREAGCRRFWLNTTNDNIRAIRFYQRRGMRLAAARPGAVDRARLELKPEIPLHGENGIPIRDELEFEVVLS